MAIKLSDETRKRLISSVRRYFEENMDEAVGDLKATLLLEVADDLSSGGKDT